MKKLSLAMLVGVLVGVLVCVAFGLSGCVDIDEALPHYRVQAEPQHKVEICY